MPDNPYFWGALALAAYLAIGSMAGQYGVLGAFRGEDGRLSSSKFQFFFWTGIVVFAYGAIAAKHMAVSPAESLPQLPSNVLLAMGFSVITLAGAKGVTTAYIAAGRIAKGSHSDTVSLADLVRQDDGVSPDLSKIQMLTWTLIAAVSYLFAVHGAIDSFSASTSGSWKFPDIDAALMALMGIGNGAYLGSKIVASQSATITSLQPARGGAAGTQVTINGSGFGTSPGTVQFGDVVAAIATAASSGGVQWSDGAVTFTVPPTHSDGTPFAAGEKVYVALLLQSANGANSSNTIPYNF